LKAAKKVVQKKTLSLDHAAKPNLTGAIFVMNHLGTFQILLLWN